MQSPASLVLMHFSQVWVAWQVHAPATMDRLGEARTTSAVRYGFVTKLRGAIWRGVWWTMIVRFGASPDPLR